MEITLIKRYDQEQAAARAEKARKQVERDRELSGYTQEQMEKAQAQAAVLASGERLYFLANIIANKDIPRRSRQIFFDEYIAKGGNDALIAFWYDEEETKKES